MIDFVKLVVKDVLFIKKNKNLDFEVGVNLETGELRNYCEAEKEGLVFRLYDNGTLIIKGSLHKYYNKGEHNHNSFNWLMLNRSIDKLINLIDVDAELLVLQNIEVGVNISPYGRTLLTLMSIMFHKSKQFSISKGGYYGQVQHSDYYLKVYDKAKQYGLNTQIMRVELKYVKMRTLNSKGIYNLGDLRTMDKVKPLIELLKHEWNEVLMFDSTINLKRLKPLDIQLSSHLYWIKNKCRTAKMRSRKRLLTITSKYSLRLQENNLIRIKDKWEQLFITNKVAV